MSSTPEYFLVHLFHLPRVCVICLSLMLRNGARGYEGPVIKFVDVSGVQTMAELGEGESPVCSLPVEGGDDGDDGDDDSG